MSVPKLELGNEMKGDASERSKLELGNEVKATANERSQAGAWERGEGNRKRAFPKLELGTR